MKKIWLLIVMVVGLISFSSSVSALDYASCNAFADRYLKINGTYNYKRCYKVTCSYGVYNKSETRETPQDYSCANGNTNPYVSLINTGCSGYTGSCNFYGQKFCTTVEFVDCGKTSNGQEFDCGGGKTTVVTNRPTTQTPTTTTKKPTTTKRPTTNKPTATKPVVTTNPTTQVETTTTTTTEVQSSTNIKKILVNDTDIKYDSSKDSYTIKMLYDITEVDVKVELEDERAQVSITGNTDMPNEDHEIKIVVTSLTGEAKEVTLKVKRYTNLSNDCTLANIYSEEYPLDFSKNNYNYKLTLPKKAKAINLEVVPTDTENATYEVTGNENLKNRSVIKIDVRAEDGTMCQYTIKIKKNSNTWKYIIIIVLLISILIGASFFLYRYLMKSKGKYKYE